MRHERHKLAVLGWYLGEQPSDLVRRKRARPTFAFAPHEYARPGCRVARDMPVVERLGKERTHWPEVGARAIRSEPRARQRGDELAHVGRVDLAETGGPEERDRVPLYRFAVALARRVADAAPGTALVGAYPVASVRVEPPARDRLGLTARAPTLLASRLGERPVKALARLAAMLPFHDVAVAALVDAGIPLDGDQPAVIGGRFVGHFDCSVVGVSAPRPLERYGALLRPKYRGPLTATLPRRRGRTRLARRRGRERAARRGATEALGSSSASERERADRLGTPRLRAPLATASARRAPLLARRARRRACRARPGRRPARRATHAPGRSSAGAPPQVVQRRLRLGLGLGRRRRRAVRDVGAYGVQLGA